MRCGVLSAVCKSDDGKKARFASVAIGNCQAFANRDGALVCESDGSSGGAVQWGGSFSQSCRDRSTNSNGVLTVTWQTADGRWRRTSLSPAQCRDRLAGNQDGTLVCEQ